MIWMRCLLEFAREMTEGEALSPSVEPMAGRWSRLRM
jgi:hypothetical protein